MTWIEKLDAVLATPSDESQKYKLAYPPGQTPEHEGPEEARIRTLSPISFGLPRSWDSIQPGHVVLVHESPADGWWEATVQEREEEILTLKFRDYPRQPKFQRYIPSIGRFDQPWADGVRGLRLPSIGSSPRSSVLPPSLGLRAGPTGTGLSP